MLVQDLASDSPSLSHPFGHWAEPGWFLWLISSRLISLCLGTWNPCLLGNNREFWTGMYCFKYRKLIVCRKAMGEWGLVFSLGRNTWAALLCSAHILEPELWECASPPSPSFVFCFILFFSILFYFIRFYSSSDKVLSALIHPHRWPLLRVTSGPQDFWEHVSYSWGCSKILLCQVENEAVISPGSAQHKGRGAPSSCFISF